MMLLSGCEVMPTQEQMQVADYGSIPKPESAIKTAKSLILATLLDPYSAVVNCGNPVKGVVNKTFKNQYGYIVECRVNAKNRFGAFTGEDSSYFWIRNGHMEAIELPFDFVPATSR
jgi:hypothetical protein